MGFFMMNHYLKKRHEKVKLCETDNMEYLIQIKQALNERNISYDISIKKSSIINNIFFLICYHVFTSGLEHKNEIMCIYVDAKDIILARDVIARCKKI